MREHPIPQDITGYQFHLIGEMTLKQFAEVAVGVVLGFIFYKTSLPSFVRYPLALIFAGGGALLAFVPFEERPLDKWLIIFLKTLYKPTKFYWKKANKIPDHFTHEARTDVEDMGKEIDLSPLRRKKIKEYLGSLNRPETNYVDDWDAAEAQKVGQILNDFSAVEVPKNINFEIKKEAPNKPDLKVRVRKLQNKQPVQQVVFQKQATPPSEINSKITTDKNFSIDNNLNNSSSAMSSNQNSSCSNSLQSQPQQTQKALNTTPDPELTEPTEQNSTHQESYAQGNEEATKTSSKQAVIGSNLPFPNKPTEPNKIVGMVIDNEGSLIGGAIIEIKTKSGQILRAVKSNSLGQFFVSTALDNGNYILETSKQGLNFPNYNLELTGKIISPLEIKAETN